MSVKTYTATISAFVLIPLSQNYGQGMIEGRLPYGNRPILDYAEAHALRVQAFHPYLLHLENASELRQAREDFVYAYYELSFSYLRAMGDPALHGQHVAIRCADRLQHLFRGYPAQPEALYLEATLQLDSLMFAKSLPDADFKRVMETIGAIQGDGPAAVWINAIKAKIFGSQNAEQLLEDFLQPFQINKDEAFHAGRIRSAFKSEDSHLAEIARRCKQLGLGEWISKPDAKK